MTRKKVEYNPQPDCPHCGGIHYGQRYDNCPYLKLAAQGNENARSILEANGTTVPGKEQEGK